MLNVTPKAAIPITTKARQAARKRVPAMGALEIGIWLSMNLVLRLPGWLHVLGDRLLSRNELVTLATLLDEQQVALALGNQGTRGFQRGLIVRVVVLDRLLGFLLQLSELQLSIADRLGRTRQGLGVEHHRPAIGRQQLRREIGHAVAPAADDVIDLEDPSLSVRIVCVSDTHGMESVLSGSVPAGDVFIHAGDFAADKGKSRLKLKQLDEWMATLPHELKIVVRGNHDPSGGCFPLSKAIYAERATTVMFRGVAIGLAPHGTINVPSASIVVSHEPPYGVLDQALGKKKPHVGSHYLQKSAMRLVSKPQLWIFGHIHEGFGAIRTTFGSKGLTTHPKGSPVYSSTLCVNAANANPGPAHSIDNLPICIDIKRISDAKEKIENGEEMIDIALKP